MAPNNFVYGAGDPGILSQANPPLATWQGEQGHKIAYTAQLTNLPGWVYSPLIIDAKAPTGNVGYEWAFLSRMSNYANGGQNVAVTGQGYKYAGGMTWAGVFEAQDFSNGCAGALYGQEVDVLANGEDAHNRYGTQYVFGKANKGPGFAPALISYGVQFVPQGGVRADARLRSAVKVDIDCDESAINIGNGATMPSPLDLRAAGVIPFLLRLSSGSGPFSAGPVHSSQWIAHMVPVELDGVTFYFPLYTKGLRP